MLNNMGILVCMDFDEVVQDLLDEEEATEALYIRGTTDDPENTTLLEQIRNTIATDTHTEKITRDVYMLTEIQICCRHTDYNPSQFSNRFKITVPRYITQKPNTNNSDTR